MPVPPPKRAALTPELQLALEFVPDEALREIIRETARVGLGRLEEHEVRVKRAEEARERRRVERALRDGPKRR
ncbi:MAG: hypothetical protein IPG17_03275 [Sandaracinaceae bacterium]|nr:hypothetical protein [Sandaracinaceae bacterium]MBK6809764.1 hypothetical protein [Sandaracinaceae bacterium]MBK7155811.1 hypothetical protein [Sandaracinaceae bacterium]MBK7778413.1 hypothetical protein [Sandaracinaceae bacterium]